MTGGPRPIPSQRRLFDIPEDVAYLNCAYLSPLLKRAAEIGRAAVDRKSHPWEIAGSDFIDGPEELRALYARLLGAAPADIALAPSASYGAATAARNLRVEGGQRVIVLEHQFPSNSQPWMELAQARNAELVTVPRPADGAWTGPVLAAIDERAALVALPNCHWMDGTLVDLAAVSRRTHEAGAALVLDLTQSLGALPFDLEAIDPDYVLCAGYKWLLGPYSLGFLYAAPRRQDGPPLEHNYFARATAPAFEKLVGRRFQGPLAARRYEVGESANFALLPIAAVGVRQLLDWGVPNIQATLRAYTDALAERLQGMGLLVAEAQNRAGHFLGARVPGGLPEGLLERLAARRVYLSARGDSLRITPHLFNDETDADRLVEALAGEL